jgi:hypothetical protein
MYTCERRHTNLLATKEHNLVTYTSIVSLTISILCRTDNNSWRSLARNSHKLPLSILHNESFPTRSHLTQTLLKATITAASTERVLLQNQSTANIRK